MPPRRNNHTFEIGTRLGQLDQGQKDLSRELQEVKVDTTEKLIGLEKAVGGFSGELHMFKEACDEKFGSIQQSLEDIQNPKLSLKTLVKLAVKGATYAGGAGITLAAIWTAFQQLLRVWTR